MSEASKKKLFVIAPFMAFYVLFSFLPLQPWLGEWGFLVLRFVCFTVCAGLLVFFKNHYHWSIDHPNKELRYTFLFPLTIFCFINFFSVPFFKFNLSIEAEDIGLMFMESATDFSASVFEDVLFVNLLIGLLLDLVNWKYKRSFSVLLSAVLLTAAHSYTFLYPGEFPASDPLQVACVQEAFIFLITAGCGYLSMFFDSAVIPSLSTSFITSATTSFSTISTIWLCLGSISCSWPSSPSSAFLTSSPCGICPNMKFTGTRKKPQVLLRLNKEIRLTFFFGQGRFDFGDEVFFGKRASF